MHNQCRIRPVYPSIYSQYSLLLLVLCFPALISQPLAAEQTEEDFSGLHGTLGPAISVNSLENNFYAFGDASRYHRGLNKSSKQADEQHIIPVGILTWGWFGGATGVYASSLPGDTFMNILEFRLGAWQALSYDSRLYIEYRPTTKTRIWNDPYKFGRRNRGRDEVNTIELGWVHPFDIPLNIQISKEKHDFGHDDQSGHSLGLSPAAINDLKRDGDLKDYALSYELEHGPWMFVPRLSYTDNDRKGRAESDRGWQLALKSSWHRDAHVYEINVYHSQMDSRKINPVVHKKIDPEVIGIDMSYMQENFLGRKQLQGQVAVYYAKRNSDSSFHKAQATGIGLSLLWTL